VSGFRYAIYCSMLLVVLPGLWRTSRDGKSPGLRGAAAAVFSVATAVVVWAWGSFALQELARR